MRRSNFIVKLQQLHSKIPFTHLAMFIYRASLWSNCAVVVQNEVPYSEYLQSFSGATAYLLYRAMQGKSGEFCCLYDLLSNRLFQKLDADLLKKTQES